jgi:SAM-dependent methyltransferase
MMSLLLNPFLLYFLLGTVRISNHVTAALCFHRRRLRSSYGRQLDFKFVSTDNESDVNKWMSKMDGKFNGSQDSDEEKEEEDTVNAQSAFGTKKYWNEMYSGRGDFSSDQYSWYYGWETIQPFWLQATQLLIHSNSFYHQRNNLTSSTPHQESQELYNSMARRVLLPGVGNDSDMIYKIYKNGHCNITAIDYSPRAIERLQDFLPFLLPSHHHKIKLYVMDARCLDPKWSNYFDIIFEKGTLDAIFLSSCRSDSKNLKLAISELYRVLRPEGVLLSVSGVIPESIRREMFPTTNATDSNSACWEWIRDGSNDLQAGCFIFRKK